MQSEQYIRLRHLTAARLESLQLAGVLQLPRAKNAVVRQRAPVVPPAADPAPELITPQVSSPESAAPMSKKSAPLLAQSESWFEARTIRKHLNPSLTLEVLQQEVAGCTRCGELAAT